MYVKALRGFLRTNEGFPFYERLAEEPGFIRKKNQNDITVKTIT